MAGPADGLFVPSFYLSAQCWSAACPWPHAQLIRSALTHAWSWSPQFEQHRREHGGRIGAPSAPRRFPGRWRHPVSRRLALPLPTAQIETSRRCLPSVCSIGPTSTSIRRVATALGPATHHQAPATRLRRGTPGRGRLPRDRSPQAVRKRATPGADDPPEGSARPTMPRPLEGRA
jgi:hypothetical protein